MVVVVMINMMDIHRIFWMRELGPKKPRASYLHGTNPQNKRIFWGLYPTGETLLNVAPKYKIVDLIISGETSMLMILDLSYDSYIIYC